MESVLPPTAHLMEIHNPFSEQAVFLGDVWLKSRRSAAASAGSGVGRALDFTSPFPS